MPINDKTIDITISREKIRETIIKTLEDVFRNKGYVLDTSSSSFGIFLGNVVSTLLHDTLYYVNFMYGENTLITANLSQSIHNWANYIDYEPSFATSAKTTLTFVFPLENSFRTLIQPYEHVFETFSGIGFTVSHPIEVINIDGTVEVRQYDETTQSYTTLPYQVVLLETGVRAIQFNAEAKNEFIIELNYKVPPLRPFEMYDIPITLNERQYLVNIELFVDNVKWYKKPIILSRPDETVYDVYFSSSGRQLIVRTGNDIFGKQVRGNELLIKLYLCNGKEGNVQPNTILKGPILLSGTSVVTYFVYNKQEASGGSDGERLQQIKYNAPIHLRMRYRNVTQQDYQDELRLSPFVDHSEVILKRSDTGTNDVNVYILLKDLKTEDVMVGGYVPTSTITIDIAQLGSQKVIYPFTTELKSIALWDNNVTYVSPYLILIDMERDTWFAYLQDIEEKLVFRNSFSISNVDSQPSPTNLYSCVINEMSYQLEQHEGVLRLKAVFNLTSSHIESTPDPQPIELLMLLRKRNGSLVQLQPTQINPGTQNDGNLVLGQNVVFFDYTYSSFDELREINLLDFQVSYRFVNQDKKVLMFSFTCFPSFLSNFIDYGPVVTDLTDDKVYLTDVPVVEKTYIDSLSTELRDKLVSLLLNYYNISLHSEKKRMLNTFPHLKFARTVGKLNNINYSFTELFAKDVVSRKTTLNNLATSPGETFLVSDPVPPHDPLLEYAGTVCTYIGTDPNSGEKIFKFTRPAQSTIVDVNGVKYVLVDTRWMSFNHYELLLDVEVDVFVENPTQSGLEDKYKTVICEYINNRSPETSIRFSDIVALLYNIPGTKFVRFTKPKHDFLYNYNKKLLLDISDKEEFLTYVPEKLYTTLSNIKVNIKPYQTW